MSVSRKKSSKSTLPPPAQLKEEPVKASWHLWEYDKDRDVTVYRGVVDSNYGDDEVSQYFTEEQHQRFLSDEETFGPTYVKRTGQ